MVDEQKNIRKPTVAGSFYPANSVELTKSVASLFSEVDKPPITGRPLALISPHAGFPYSGKVAAKAYKLLEGEEFDTVVVVSPSHTVFFKGCSVYDGAGYETPITLVETDREIVDKMAGINPLVYHSNMGHATGSTRGEHALEVQLPFLQVVLGKFRLVAIVMGDQEEESVQALGEILASVLDGTNSLMVASTDLSHYHPEQKARLLDFEVQKAIEQFDPTMLMETLESGKGEACGGGPVAAVMYAAKRLGGCKCRFVDYDTSGSVTGDFDEVVGYLSAVVIAREEAKADRRETKHTYQGKLADKYLVTKLSSQDQEALHRIARESIAARFENREFIPESNSKLRVERGLFVTLKLNGELRGCIGQIKARQPLYLAVASMAQAAAFEDPRFPQMTADELPELEYEISVLSPLERVTILDKIKIGRDGLMIKLDMHSGLLLPQVAIEHEWDRTEFLEQTCLKAGLPKDSYKKRFAEIYKFSAQVF